MSINYEKIVSVFKKERGLCEGTLIERNDSRRRTVGCAIGSLLWNAGFKKLDTLDSHVCPSPEWDESKQEWVEPNKAPELIARKILAEEYGITKEEEIYAIIEANDSAYLDGCSRKERRDHMIAWVEAGMPEDDAKFFEARGLSNQAFTHLLGNWF